MKISTRVRYGLRALVELAAIESSRKESPKEPACVLLEEITKRQNLSKKYVHALFNLLLKAGIIKAKRGVKGGYCLSKSVEEISVLEVFRILEGPVFITDCLRNAEICKKSDDCVTRYVWEGINSAIVNYLKNLTLKDLIERRKK